MTKRKPALKRAFLECIENLGESEYYAEGEKNENGEVVLTTNQIANYASVDPRTAQAYLGEEHGKGTAVHRISQAWRVKALPNGDVRIY